MNVPSPAELTRNLPSLSTLPAVMGELQRAINDPEATLEVFGKIIEKDPDLTARILRIANSAFYGLQSKVETVVQALSLIGVGELKQLLSGGSVVEYFQNIPPEVLNMKSFWQHSVASGIAARELASQCRVLEPERFFVAGLIHAIGRLVLLLKAPDAYLAVLQTHRKTQEPLHEVEKEMLGYTHAEVGSELLLQWNFPHTLRFAVRYQHAPGSTASAFLEAAIVHTAVFIAESMQLGNSGETLIPPLNTTSFDKIGLPPHALQSTIREVDRQFGEVMALFV